MCSQDASAQARLLPRVKGESRSRLVATPPPSAHAPTRTCSAVYGHILVSPICT
ncbi:uncharacterized protein TRAVEDRAFT_29155 [Trametes versicolor FP-101664 SS1]|uniref:uncharacterized protein n=1 Tax=Trametes versicolor (strain FP-101664) TaxID=717944 RepID=UPI0004623A90|nr:uncharacterized protein TRAVEDRAFT_29155 [Trametes versicolor FP-101664 SS1]EIW58645.1 hypothetical protein TRAVEDRAFT_29155 [Trametes versicolor FP-101664 SS1]